VNLRDVAMPAPEEGFPQRFVVREVSGRERSADDLIGCALYEVEPGKQLWPYHFHYGNEEWVVVVSGTPTVRTPDGQRELRAGDVVAFAQGEDGAHTFYNRSPEPARILFFSTLRRGSVVYPDSDKVGAGGLYFRRSDAVDYWDGESGQIPSGV
jgi:uncharacterized cupin superfamily protein